MSINASVKNQQNIEYARKVMLGIICACKCERGNLVTFYFGIISIIVGIYIGNGA